MTQTCVTWLKHVWHDSNMCDMTQTCDTCTLHCYAWHSVCTPTTWLMHTCDMTPSSVRYDSFIPVTWLMHTSPTNTDVFTTRRVRHAVFTFNFSVSPPPGFSPLPPPLFRFFYFKIYLCPIPFSPPAPPSHISTPPPPSPSLSHTLSLPLSPSHSRPQTLSLPCLPHRLFLPHPHTLQEQITLHEDTLALRKHTIRYMTHSYVIFATWLICAWLSYELHYTKTRHDMNQSRNLTHSYVAVMWMTLHENTIALRK